MDDRLETFLFTKEEHERLDVFLTACLPEFSRSAVHQFARHGLDHKVVVLPCGHYTTGETPYKYIDGWNLASFMRTAFEG